jgi:hypothetical protein
MVPWSQFSRLSFLKQSNISCFSIMYLQQFLSKNKKKYILLHLESGKHETEVPMAVNINLWHITTFIFNNFPAFILVYDTIYRPTLQCIFFKLIIHYSFISHNDVHIISCVC